MQSVKLEYFIYCYPFFVLCQRLGNHKFCQNQFSHILINWTYNNFGTLSVGFPPSIQVYKKTLVM